MAHVDHARVFGQVVFVAMLVERVKIVVGVRKIPTGEILWPSLELERSGLHDTMLADGLPLRLRVVRVSKILASPLANRLGNGIRVFISVVGQIERRVDILPARAPPPTAAATS